MSAPPPFTVWLRSLGPQLGLTLSPAQLYMWRVLADGAEPGDDDLGRAIFGGGFPIPAVARRSVALRKGARIGGSMISAYRLMHLGLTVNLSGLAKGERASGCIVAPDMSLARQTLRFVAGLVDVIGLQANTKTTDSLTITRRDGHQVALECLPATAGGRAVRGRSLVGAVMSEAAFFRDSDYAVNDVEIFRAIMPRLVRGGQLIIESTPFAESGLLFSLDRDNFAEPKTAVVAHAPTSLMRPDMIDEVEALRRRDPQRALVEFDGEYLSAGSGLFFDPAAVDAAVDPNLVLPCARQGAASCGADFAFESDSSALALVDAVTAAKSTAPHLRVIYLEELAPKKGAPLRTDETVKLFAATAKYIGARSICSDAHYRRAIVEHLDKTGVSFEDAPAGRPGKTQVYLLTRELLYAKRLTLPPHERLLAQMKAIVSKPVPGGGLAISSPRRGRSGGHGDLVSALTLAVHMAAGDGAPVDYAAAMRALRGRAF